MQNEPMRRGINVIPEGPVADVLAIAARAESNGFDRCWVYDEGLATRDVYLVLAAIAGVTSKMQLGPGITNPYTRHPAQTAASIATLDEISDGRAFLGVGAGGSLTLGPLGIAHPRPLTAVRETIDVARSLFGGESVNYDGTFVSLNQATLSYARPDLEIWVAGRGPKMLALGGERADGVLLDFIHKDHLAEVVATVRHSNPAARICYSTAVVTDHGDLDWVRPHMTYRLVDSPAPIRAAIGMTDSDVAAVREAMADGTTAAASLIRDEWMEPFIISGSVSACHTELASLMSEHQLQEFLLPMFEMPEPLRYLDRISNVL